MGKTIAVAGKGGTGKTTVAALLIHLLSKSAAVLAVDADPSTNLNMALGVPVTETVGDVREDLLDKVKGGTFEAGVPKRDYLEVKIQQALVEHDNFDLLAMGSPEGSGCYCAANHMLRSLVDRLMKSYSFVVMDNEAGMEHISRQITRDVDILLLISEPTVRGMTTAIRIKELAERLKNSIKTVYLVLNKVNGGLSPEVTAAISDSGLRLLASIPWDERMVELDAAGRPMTELPEDSPAYSAVRNLAKELDLI